METLEHQEALPLSPDDYFALELHQLPDGIVGSMTELPHETELPMEGKNVEFYQLNATSTFLEINPRLSESLRVDGYTAEKHETQGGEVISFAFPGVAEQPVSPEVTTEDHMELSEQQDIYYDSTEFVTALAEGKLLIANFDKSVTDGKEDVPIHDAMFHDVMYKVFEKVPTLNAGLRAKAVSMLANEAALPPKPGYNDHPEDLTIVFERQRVKEDIKNFLGNAELMISTAGPISFVMNQIAQADERYHEDSENLRLLAFNLREIFMTAVPRNDPEGRASKPDEAVSDEQISDWAKALFELAG